MSGEERLSDYQFGAKTVHHFFCKTCGMRPFERGYHESVGGEFYSVNVACLDDVAVGELFDGPVRYADGRNNDWLSAPEETRHL